MAWNNQTPNRPNSHQWQKLRKTTLHRDNHTCQLNYPGCTTTATEVDHISNLTTGGTNKLDNLQAVCTNCHKQKTQHESLASRTRHKRKPKPHPLDTPTTTPKIVTK